MDVFDKYHRRGVETNPQNAFPPSMGIKQKYASHRAWGSQFQLFEHPPSENDKSEKRTLQALTAIAAF